ncbi:MAG: hypothetical protein BroJett038_33140 [Chloroflexota bacterium]|nr:MAG: hypothetical protein BroJett038_33140 [Chloroflexota bacterium]
MASGSKVTPAGIEEVRWVLPNGRASDVVSYEEEMVRFFVDAADLLGVPKSLAAVYGIIFATPEPLSFSEIAAKLNFSNGSVSQALRVLREIGAVSAAVDGDSADAGGRTAVRERFVPDLELRKLVGRFLQQRLEKQLAASSTRLELLKRTMPGGDKRTNVELTRRLKSLADWHNRAKQLLPVVRTVLRITP